MISVENKSDFCGGLLIQNHIQSQGTGLILHDMIWLISHHIYEINYNDFNIDFHYADQSWRNE